MPNFFRACLFATLTFRCAASFAQQTPPPNRPLEKAGSEPIITLERFVAAEKIDDPMGVIPNAPTDSVFGIAKPSLETPRSLTYLSGEMIEQYGISDIADLSRVAPSTYTTFNFGIQGGIDIRNVAGDSYFRGVKRVENRSSLPTPLGATDRVEIVRGPPSPIYGNGKIGGYLNYVPKTARASTGKYFENPKGKSSLLYGTDDKRQITGEFGGPFTVAGKSGGYYVYAQFEDSGGFYDEAFKQQEILQATFNVDISRTMRIEAGTMLQNWKGVGVVGWNRVTQDLIDNGNYVAGLPLLNLDTDGSGVIELNEINAAGGLVRTIPYSALGNPAALPILPAQYALDPATVRTVQMDTRRVILEPFVEAHDEILFADAIFDLSPSTTLTNKVYLEALKQLKYQSLSFARRQDQFSFENKLTLEQRGLRPFAGITFNGAYSLNFRYSDNDLATSANNQIYSRPDLSRPLTPNVQIANSLQHTARYPWGSRTKSTYSEWGFGTLANFDFENIPISVIVGSRYDYIDATSSTPSGLANNAAPASATNTDEGISYSASLTYNLGKSWRPYITVAEQSILIAGNGGTMSLSTINLGPLDTAGLFEAGIKGSLLAGKLFVAAAYYDQVRKSFDSDTGETTATRGEGFEIEIKYAPHRRWSISLAGNWQKTIYDPLTTRNYIISPEVAGYNPAAVNAGQIRTTLPAIGDYLERSGTPDRTISLSSSYYLNNAWALSASLAHQSRFAADVMKTIHLPEANVLNLSLIRKIGYLTARLSVYNVTDERYFRANQADSAGGVQALPNPGRTGDLRLSYEF